MKIPAAWMVFAGLSLVLAACTPSNSTLFANEAQMASVAPALPHIEVLSGDTLVVDGRHIRLANAAAPQPAPHARCAAEALGARQARLRFTALSLGVQKVIVTPNGTVDDHGRTLATVYLDGVDPAQVLVQEGLAVAPGGRAFDWCAPISDTLDRGQHIALLSLAGS